MAIGMSLLVMVEGGGELTGCYKIGENPDGVPFRGLSWEEAAGPKYELLVSIAGYTLGELFKGIFTVRGSERTVPVGM